MHASHISHGLSGLHWSCKHWFRENFTRRSYIYDPMLLEKCWKAPQACAICKHAPDKPLSLWEGILNIFEPSNMCKGHLVTIYEQKQQSHDDSRNSKLSAQASRAMNPYGQSFSSISPLWPRLFMTSDKPHSVLHSLKRNRITPLKYTDIEPESCVDHQWSVLVL